MIVQETSSETKETGAGSETERSHIEEPAPRRGKDGAGTERRKGEDRRGEDKTQSAHAHAQTSKSKYSCEEKEEGKEQGQEQGQGWEEEKPAGANSMQEEDRNTGSVPLEVYQAYIQAGGGWKTVVPLFFLLIVERAAFVLQDLWVCQCTRVYGYLLEG